MKHQGVWKTLSNLEIARSHCVVIPHQQTLYIFGGGGPDFKSLDNVVAFDTITEQWQTKQSMPSARSGTAGFLIQDQIYLIGGGFKKPDGNFKFLTTVDTYHPTTDSWQSAPAMNQPHDYPAATLIGDTIYILGGHHPEACLGGPKTDPGFDYCESFTPGDTQWQPLAPLPTPRFAAAAITHQNRLYATGGVAFRPEGFNNFDLIETFSPEDNQWQQETDLQLPWPAAGHSLCYIDNTIFMFGGYSTDNIHNRAACFNMDEKKWHRLPAMPTPRAAMGLGIIGNTIYLVGGWEDDGRTPVNTVMSYTF